MRYNLSREKYLKTVKERDGATVIQANWRAFTLLKDWEWQKLLFKIRPLLNTTEKQKEMEELLAEYDAMVKELEQETAMRKKLEAEHVALVQMKNSLMNDFAGESDAIQGVINCFMIEILVLFKLSFVELIGKSMNRKGL